MAMSGGSPLPAIRVVGRRDDILRLIDADGRIVKIVPVWRDVAANLSAYLAQQRVANVSIVRASEPAEQNARFGKFRQVIAVPQAGT